MIKLNNKGQTFIEAVLAIAIATIVVAAIAMVVITSVNNATFSKNQNLATQYAQQGMDKLRQESESDWTAFFAHPVGIYCLNPGPLVLSGDCTTPNIDNTFIRKVQIQKPGGVPCTVEKATVTVYWADGKCSAGDYCHLVKIESCFTQTNYTSWP